MKLNVHERILAYGMLYEDDYASVSSISEDGVRRATKVLTTDKELSDLVNSFSADPKTSLAFLRNNMFAIGSYDAGVSKEHMIQRVWRYLPDFFSLMIKLDHAAYSHDKRKVLQGVPDYLPDGLSDMGADDNQNTRMRAGREKIHVDKKRMFDDARTLFHETYSDIRTKEEIIQRVATWVYYNMPYDHENLAKGLGKRSVVLDINVQQAVCRHHALYTQVLNQAFGLTTRLMKCLMTTDKSRPTPHAANLVRIDRAWYVLDVTNPETHRGKKHVFLRRIPETHVDTNRRNYEWVLDTVEGRRCYSTRNNMFYRIK